MPGHLPVPEYAQVEEAQEVAGLLAYNRLLRRLLHTAFDLIFPPRCSGCGRVDTMWCINCQNELVNTPLTTRLRHAPMLEVIASTGLHSGKLQSAVHALKYDGVRPLADVLAQRLALCLWELEWTFDILVPVPLHTTRFQERGYNQSQEISAALATCLRIPSIPDALHRIRDTGSQVGLNKQQRLTNVADAFRADPTLVQNQTILLIDDVFTTGATLVACAEALRHAGALHIFGLTVTTARDSTLPEI